MWEKQTEDQITFLIAVYGALTGTIALVWDVFKWRMSETRLHVRVQPDMKWFAGDVPLPQGFAPQDPDSSHVMISVQNRGGKSTTLTSLGVVVYKSGLHALFKRSPQYFYIARPRTLQPIPYSLDVGKEWTGTIDQTAEVEGYIAQHYYVLVGCSTRTKSVRCRVKRYKRAG
jgi:hypothetical protein